MSMGRNPTKWAAQNEALGLDSLVLLWNQCENRKGTAMARNCVEFVILSGPEAHDHLVTAREQLRAYLIRQFPDYRFSLAAHEGEAMGFLVVPVVGSIGGDDNEYASPQYAVLAEIRMALEAFSPVGAVLH